MFQKVADGMGRSDLEAALAEAEAQIGVLKKALAIALNENHVLNQAVTRVQGRCTELLYENRALREQKGA